MKVCLLTDTHAGVRNNSSVFMEHQIQFFEQVLFPYVQQNNIKHMIHLGDVFDRRKDTNNYAIHEWDDRVFAKWESLFEKVHIIIGNHDTYFKNTNSINTPQRFLSQYKKFQFYVDPCEQSLYGVDTLILPWICESNASIAANLIESSDASLVLGHLEVVGSPMFRGIENIDRGFEPSVFGKFKKVLSGHFHIKSHQKNIHYLGSPYATTWAEALDSRGFHVLDTDTLKLTFVENPHNPFVYVEYDESEMPEPPQVKNKVVKVLIKKKESESKFLQFLESLEAQSPAEINVTEQKPVADLQVSVDENLDLFSLMDLYVDNCQFDSSKSDLKKMLRELYDEALHLHGISE